MDAIAVAIVHWPTAIWLKLLTVIVAASTEALVATNARMAMQFVRTARRCDRTLSVVVIASPQQDITAQDVWRASGGRNECRARQRHRPSPDGQSIDLTV